jgi:hypothetical protein
MLLTHRTILQVMTGRIILTFELETIAINPFTEVYDTGQDMETGEMESSLISIRYKLELSPKRNV